MSEILDRVHERAQAIEDLELPRIKRWRRKRLIQELAHKLVSDNTDFESLADHAKTKLDLVVISSALWRYDVQEELRAKAQETLDTLRGVSTIPGQLELIDTNNLDIENNNLVLEIGEE